MPTAGGANLICFTTGRGSAYGCAPAPSMKLATNTALWQRQSADMDINCGGIVDGEVSVNAMGEQIFQQIPRTRPARRPGASCTAMARTSLCPGNWARSPERSNVFNNLINGVLTNDRSLTSAQVLTASS